MRCLSLLLVFGLLTASPAFAEPVKSGGPSSTAMWKQLSKLNEPPGQPSIRAARVATAHLSREQIREKHFRLVMLYREASAKANGTALQILKREIQLLHLAGAE